MENTRLGVAVIDRRGLRPNSYGKNKQKAEHAASHVVKKHMPLLFPYQYCSWGAE